MKTKNLFPLPLSLCSIFIIISSILLFPFLQPAYAQILDGALTIGGEGADRGESLSIDEQGNTLVCGSMDRDIFIGKYDSNHDLLWSFKISSSGYDECRGVEADPHGNVYVVGRLGGIADFDPGPGEHFLYSDVTYSIFIAKYNTEGGFEWAFDLDSGGTEISYGLDVDEGANLYIIGDFVGVMDFDPGPTEYKLDGEGARVYFIASYNTSGALNWAHTAQGPNGTSTGRDIEVKHGYVYTTGTIFPGTAIDFDPGPGRWILRGRANTAFVARYSTNGTFQWAEALITGSGGITGHGIAVDENGHAVITGHDVQDASGESYLAKYDQNGSLIWMFNIENAAQYHNDIGWDVTTDFNGDIYVAGRFLGQPDFDPSKNRYYLTSEGESLDIFLAKYTTDGQFRWAFKVGSAYTEEATAVDVDELGHVSITGNFKGTSDFDPGPGVFDLTAVEGDRDMFVAHYIDGAAASEQGSVSGLEFIKNTPTQILSGLSNHPNPFNPSTTIRFTLSEQSKVRLSVYDMLGRTVRVLLDETLDTGRHKVNFDADALPSGTYLYRLETPEGSFTRTMLLLK